MSPYFFNNFHYIHFIYTRQFEPLVRDFKNQFQYKKSPFRKYFYNQNGLSIYEKIT